MRIIKAADYQDMSRKGSKSYLCPGYYEAGLRIRLATGSTPIGAYQQLVECARTGIWTSQP